MKKSRFYSILFSICLFTTLVPVTIEASFRSRAPLWILAMLAVHMTQQTSPKQNEEQNLLYLAHEPQHIAPFTEDLNAHTNDEVRYFEKRRLQDIDEVICDCSCNSYVIDMFLFLSSILVGIFAWGAICIEERKTVIYTKVLPKQNKEQPKPPSERMIMARATKDGLVV